MIKIKYLTQDVRSYVKPSCLYARKGQKVKVIGTNGNLSIVEKEDGDRISVFSNTLSQEFETDCGKTAPIDEPVLRNNIVNPKTRRGKLVPAASLNELF